MRAGYSGPSPQSRAVQSNCRPDHKLEIPDTDYSTTGTNLRPNRSKIGGGRPLSVKQLYQDGSYTDLLESEQTKFHALPRNSALQGLIVTNDGKPSVDTLEKWCYLDPGSRPFNTPIVDQVCWVQKGLM